MVDVLIVGSGAGGAPIAYTLAKAGFSVVVLERGPHMKRKDVGKDEIALRRGVFEPNNHHIVETYNEDGSIERVSTKESGWNFNNGSLVGGSSHFMSGFFHRLKPDDFRLLSRYGAIDGANVVDWPLAYGELEPYYAKVESLVGVSGEVTPHSFLEPRSTRDFLFGKTREQSVSKLLDKAAKSLGYELFATPRAILPHDALGRGGCYYSNFCGSYACFSKAKSNAQYALLEKAQQSGNCTIVADAFVYRLENDGERVVKAHYFKNGKRESVAAKIFVVAAQAIESVRLLLNSRSSRYPDGLANNSGNVGKNLIFSAGGVGEGVLEVGRLSKEELFERGYFINRSLQQWYAFEHEGRRYKGGTIDFLYEHANAVPRAMSAIYGDDGYLQWGTKLEKALQRKFLESRVVKFEVFNDWLPTDNCFVDIDKIEKDDFGMPVAKLRLYGHPHDIFVGEFLANKATKLLEAIGAHSVTSDISPSPPPNLVAGGCRFGNDAHTSVLDKECRAHEVENLYVSDASFMPTGGSVPYTWSIYANSFRVADIIAEKLKG